MSYLIEPEMELCEIINAYPSLCDKLERLNFNTSRIVEGESFTDYFKREGLEDEEVSLLVRKLNADIKYFLKNGNLPESTLSGEDEVLSSEVREALSLEEE